MLRGCRCGLMLLIDATCALVEPRRWRLKVSCPMSILLMSILQVAVRFAVNNNNESTLWKDEITGLQRRSIRTYACATTSSACYLFSA